MKTFSKKVDLKMQNDMYKYNTTVKDLVKVLSGLPPDAKISVCGGYICSVRISNDLSIVNLEKSIPL